MIWTNDRELKAGIERLEAELAAANERADENYDGWDRTIRKWEATRAGLAAAKEEVATLTRQRDELAAVVEKTDKAFERFAAHHGSCCDVHNTTDETAPGECELCDIDRGARRHGGPSAILNAALAKARREGKAEITRWWADQLEGSWKPRVSLPQSMREYASAIESGVAEA